ncbi:MAG: MFS transporter [Polaromonas sp.]|nr:MFS transporter [Polaromonas sp.]
MSRTASVRGIDPAFIVILAGVSAALHVGKLPPAIPVLRDALGVTLVQAGFLLSLVQLAGMTLGLAVGLVADGLGLKRSMVAGLLILSTAGALGGWARDASSLLVLRGVEGFGFLLATVPAPSLIRLLVPPHRLTVMLGLWGTYMPFGAAVALLLGPVFIGATSWQVWWWLLAGTSFAMMLWLAWAVPADRHRRAVAGHSSAAHAGQGHSWPQRLRQTLTARGPWLVALSFAVYASQWLAVIGFLPSIYAQAGLSGVATGALTALAAAINMVGNIASGRLLQRGARAPVLLCAGFVTMGLGTVAAFVQWHGAGLPPLVRYAAVLLFSMIGGVIPGTLFSLAVKLAPTERTVSTTVGWMQQWSSFGQFVGPPLVAWVASRAGGWQWTWAVTGVCSILGLALAGQIGRLTKSVASKLLEAGR